MAMNPSDRPTSPRATGSDAHNPDPSQEESRTDINDEAGEVERHADLDRASTALQNLATQRALQVAPAVLARVLSQPRRSMPVRARDPHSYLRVGEAVLTALIRQRIDNDVPGVAVNEILLRIDRDDHLTEVHIDLIGQYSTSLPTTANAVRQTVTQELSAILGDITTTVHVVSAHLHFCDVTMTDPTLADPQDPQTL